MVDMASDPPENNLSAAHVDALLATLRTLGVGREHSAGTVIAHLHDQRGLSYRTIARRTGIDRSTAARWAKLARGAK
jgi:DNA-directed RNA polymerase specialized sigma24 family protein